MTATPTHIQFGHHTVAVAAEAPAMLDEVRREFRFMLGDAGPRTLAPLNMPDEPLDAALLAVRYALIGRFMDARDDLIWYHGSAAARGSAGVLFPGPRGRGKSTVVAALCARGWQFVSDDALPVHPERVMVEPFPQLPAYREYPGQAMPAEWLLSAPKRPVPISEAQVARAPMPIAALVFPSHRPDRPATITPRNPATTALALIEGCWDVPKHRERAVAAAAALARAVPAWDLAFAEGAEAADRIEEVVPAGPTR